MHSLSGRLTLVAGLLLVVFLGATGIALDRAFDGSARAALKERLEGYVFALLATAESADNGMLEVPEPLPEPRLAQAGSGLYAFILGAAGAVWRSPSFAGGVPDGASVARPGQWSFSESRINDDVVYLVSTSVVWEVGPGTLSSTYTFTVAESASFLQSQVRAYRANLWGWLAASVILLLVVQVLVLRWGLQPLRRFAHDIDEIAAGRIDALEGKYVDELAPLAENLNAMIRRDRVQMRRAREALSDLAHRLKTPLAIVRSSRDRKVMDEQIDDMNAMIEYQLQRAATSGPPVFARPLRIAGVVERVLATLQQLHVDKNVVVENLLGDDTAFMVEEGDMMEIVGNLLDNAFKWSVGRVRIQTSGDTPAVLCIEDDGPGIDSGDRERILARGQRADGMVPGHGIGLATVSSIVGQYGGTIEIGQSGLGGARVCVGFSGPNND